jgi:hypothetical protein
VEAFESQVYVDVPDTKASEPPLKVVGDEVAVPAV